MSDALGKTRGAAARPRSASDLATTVMASIAIALPLMLYLSQHVEILKHGYEIEALQRQRAELGEQARELALTRAVAVSMPEVERRALALGLVPPPSTDVFVVTGVTTKDAPGADMAPMQARLE